jgi:outer membrane protein OmpA-like peptidoglycan-associated protein
MSIEGSDDGSDIFWPGYVDAVTNLVLNLLFMLTIMIVAVFMFALELSRHKDDNPTPVVEVATETEVVQTSKDSIVQLVKAKDTEINTLQKQVEALKKQVLEKQVLAQNDLRDSQKVVIAKTPIPKPEKDLDKTAASGGGVVVNFLLDAVTLSPAESETLRNSLATVAASGTARIEVVVPAGFSEAKRLGFYRAVAVRNQLIEMNVPADKIEVLVRSADNSKVLVSPR